MKKIFLFILTILSFSQVLFSQSERKYTDDEKSRLKLCATLATYDTVVSFDNAVGEAYYTLVISSFKENLTIPKFSFSPLSGNDKSKIDGIIQILNEAKQTPPTWDDLLIKQTQYQIWLDKSIRKKSKYKN